MAADTRAATVTLQGHLQLLDEVLQRAEANLGICRNHVQSSMALISQEQPLRPLAFASAPSLTGHVPPPVGSDAQEPSAYISGPAATSEKPALSVVEEAYDETASNGLSPRNGKSPENGKSSSPEMEKSPSMNGKASRKGSSQSEELFDLELPPRAHRLSKRQPTNHSTTSPQGGMRTLAAHWQPPRQNTVSSNGTSMTSNMHKVRLSTGQLSGNSPKDLETPSFLKTLEALDSNAFHAEHAVSRRGKLNLRGTTSTSARVWRFMQNPDSSSWARGYAVGMNIYVIASAIATLVISENMPEDMAFLMEIIVECTFLFELLVRIKTAPSRRHFLHGPFNQIDMLAVLPLGLRLALGLCLPQVYEDFRKVFVGVVPLIRMLKVLRRFPKFVLLLDAFHVAAEALPVLLFTLCILHLSFSGMFYLVEPSSNVPSMQWSMWFTIVTMTTLGYGDTTPESGPGFVIAGSVVICGLLYMALPISLLGSAFQQVWHDRHNILIVSRVRAKMMEWGYHADDIPVLFDMFDSDGDGELNLTDFMHCMNEAGFGLKEDKLIEIFEVFDEDSSGQVDHEEFVRVIFPEAYLQLYGMTPKQRKHFKMATDPEVGVAGSTSKNTQDYNNQYDSESSYRAAHRKSPPKSNSFQFAGPEGSARLGGRMLAVAGMG